MSGKKQEPESNIASIAMNEYNNPNRKPVRRLQDDEAYYQVPKNANQRYLHRDNRDHYEDVEVTGVTGMRPAPSTRMNPRRAVNVNQKNLRGGDQRNVPVQNRSESATTIEEINNDGEWIVR